jgi:hypothetical protein
MLEQDTYPYFDIRYPFILTASISFDFCFITQVVSGAGIA